MSNIDEIIASAKRAEKTATLCVRGDLNAKIEELERQLGESKGWKPQSLADASPLRALAEQIEATRDEMREHEHTFLFRALPPKAWSDLLAKHPARKDRDEGFNLATFPAAAISACAVDPEMTVEQAEQLSEVLNQGQWDTLFSAAWTANVQALDIPFSLAASAILRSTEQS